MDEKLKKRDNTDSTNSKSMDIPSFVLQNRNISVLEAITHYFKHQLNLTYHEIGVLINRNDRTIWTCCNRASKKLDHNHIFQKKAHHQVMIPSSILKNRSVAVLEAITVYLKEDLSLTFHEIAELLNRDDRTIWTCYHRVQKKRGDLK